ncbi:callose synthase 9-like [Prosopis cineraria]|uniref:callose synthase 9-like n=1 Tax=Prosopis cineraria TaxID=364024 RepID=UPI002410233A|nr:callose synthase 9-like [Prosopis cineraria]
MSLLEVQAAVSALKYFRGLPELPRSHPIPAARDADMLDFLQCIFGFQKDNVSNQREHLVHLLANEQSRLGIPNETEPVSPKTFGFFFLAYFVDVLQVVFVSLLNVFQ